VVKSVVKTFCRCFFEKGNRRKSQCLQGRFLNDCKAFRGFAFRAERVFARGGVPRRLHAPKRRALPVAVSASRVARYCSRSATAATPYSSLHPPQAALGNVPNCATPRNNRSLRNYITKILFFQAIFVIL